MTATVVLRTLPIFLMISAACGDDAGPPPLDTGAGADTGTSGDSAAADGGDAGADTGTSGDAGDGGTSTDTGAADTGPVSMPCTATGPCDPFDPSSCPAGQGCQPGIGMTECVDLDPAAGAVGDSCAAPDECGPGLICLDFGDGLACRRMCPQGSIGFCGDGQACSGGAGGDMCIRICRPTPEPCDIYSQDCADPDDACTLARHPETMAAYTGCRPAGPQGEAMPCGGDDGFCQAGLICVSEAGIAACRRVCRETGGPTCGAGTACEGFSRTWMVTYCR